VDRLDTAIIDDYQSATPASLRFTRPGVVKTYAFDGTRLTVTWQLTGLAGRRLVTRLDLAMPSCDGVLGHYVLADGSIAGGFGQPLTLHAAHTLSLADGVLGGRLHLHSSRAADIECRAHQTVSQSEAGFEKIMQSAELQLLWEIPDDACSLQLQLTMEPDQR
jgi:alpha-amylase